MCRPRLQVPEGVQVPNSTDHLSEVPQAFERYQQHRELWDATLPVTQEDFLLVWKYPDIYGDPVLDYIAQNKMQGYSLYIHEVIELEWFFENFERVRVDAYKRNEHDDPTAYGMAHSLALIEEHRYLQRTARSEGHDFTLHELIHCNPVAQEPEFDWKQVMDYRAHELSEQDKSLRGNLTPVYEWYRSKRFQGSYRG